MRAPRTARARMARRYARMTLRVRVALESGAESREVFATTLGAGGLFVADEAPFAPGTPLIASFRLPEDDIELRLESRVVWSQPRSATGSEGMGLEFVDADARAELAVLLEDWAQRRPGGSGPDQV